MPIAQQTFAAALTILLLSVASCRAETGPAASPSETRRPQRDDSVLYVGAQVVVQDDQAQLKSEKTGTPEYLPRGTVWVVRGLQPEAVLVSGAFSDGWIPCSAIAPLSAAPELAAQWQSENPDDPAAAYLLGRYWYLFDPEQSLALFRKSFDQATNPELKAWAALGVCQMTHVRIKQVQAMNVQIRRQRDQAHNDDFINRISQVTESGEARHKMVLESIATMAERYPNLPIPEAPNLEAMFAGLEQLPWGRYLRLLAKTQSWTEPASDELDREQKEQAKREYYQDLVAETDKLLSEYPKFGRAYALRSYLRLRPQGYWLLDAVSEETKPLMFADAEKAIEINPALLLGHWLVAALVHVDQVDAASQSARHETVSAGKLPVDRCEASCHELVKLAPASESVIELLTRLSKSSSDRVSDLACRLGLEQLLSVAANGPVYRGVLQDYEAITKSPHFEKHRELLARSPRAAGVLQLPNNAPAWVTLNPPPNWWIAPPTVNPDWSDGTLKLLSQMDAENPMQEFASPAFRFSPIFSLIPKFNWQGHSVFESLFDKDVSINTQIAVEDLLYVGVDPNLASSDGDTVLHCIAQSKYYRPLLRKMLNGLTDVRGMRTRLNLQATNRLGHTPLDTAIHAGQADVAFWLLRHAAEPSDTTWTLANDRYQLAKKNRNELSRAVNQAVVGQFQELLAESTHDQRGLLLQLRDRKRGIPVPPLMPGNNVPNPWHQQRWDRDWIAGEMKLRKMEDENLQLSAKAAAEYRDFLLNSYQTVANADKTLEPELVKVIQADNADWKAWSEKTSGKRRP